MRRAAILGVVLGLVLVAAPAASAWTDGAGLQVVSAKALDSRLSEVRVKTAALQQPVDVRVLLPADYASDPARRYPVLYLWHGTSGRASDWTRVGDAERATAPYDLIVVMADAGFDGDGGGWFTNWFNNGRGGRPEWETFHIDQLIPWVDRNLRTIAARRGRAVYGLSQGGFGALTYAARHPDLFVSAGSYSGADEIADDPEAELLVTPVVEGTAFGLDRQSPDAMFGPRTTQEVNWAAHDPATLAANLRGMDLRLFTGNGAPGPLDSGSPNPPAMGIEWGVHELTRLFHGHLEALGIPSTYDDYGPGTHSWPYWARDLVQTLPGLMDVFADPPARPAHIEYHSGDDRWSAWGYRVVMHRPAREFSALSGGTRRGFTLSGSGSATVRTPRAYRPGSRHVVRIGTATRTLVAGRRGRLRIEVPLGPGNPFQQYTAPARALGTRVFTTRVRIGRG